MLLLSSTLTFRRCWWIISFCDYYDIIHQHIAQTPASLCPKSCFLVSYTPNLSCVPNLKLLASIFAEINKGSQFFGCSPRSDPASFGPKSCFLVSYTPNQSCVPNLKLLASMVGEIILNAGM